MDKFDNKVLLITGGTGSFGNMVANKFLTCADTQNIKEIRIFSRDEKKQDDMRILCNNKKLKFYIGDVRDFQSVENAMKGVDYVFHASALKQVPSCEFFPLEAVKTNIIGTDNVLTSAINQKVKKVICLSTDKAAYPINAMGISKAMMEKVIVAKSRTVDGNSTIIACTRYGNVMASRGSVIPLFIEQIKLGKPITVTAPNMTRFLMSLDEAVHLVLFAFNNASQGDLFIQKAPACTILNLATAIKQIFNAENEIIIIGARHGEKLYETLVTKEEMSRSSNIENYIKVGVDSRDLNYEQYLSSGSKEIELENEYNSNNTKMLDVEEIKAKLLELEYVKKEIDQWGDRR